MDASSKQAGTGCRQHDSSLVRVTGGVPGRKVTTWHELAHASEKAVRRVPMFRLGVFLVPSLNAGMEREFVVPGPDLLGRVLRDSALSAAESITQPLFHIRMERNRM